MFGIFAHLIFADKAFVFKGRLPISLQNQIFFQGIVQNQTIFVPVFRNVAHAELASLANGSHCNVMPQKGDMAAAQLFKARKSGHKFALAIPFNSGKADDFPLTYLQRNVFDSIVFMQLAGYREIAHMQHGLAGRDFILFHGKAYFPAHHHARELLFGGILNIYGTDALTLAQHGASVRNRHNFIELMGNEENGFSFLGERAHNGH
ncbi:hypothetical protein SDC9_117347 [bioreactor metagenome]|uniref:Uncharacterized protein n=1 Tax=bioreactor metagenome TaxID=1076179 RepID=A0A645BYI7_9ZZZZ